MKCPNCGDMIKGAISTAGEGDAMWYSRESLLKSILGKTLVAYACKKCGKVELIAETALPESEEIKS